MNYYKKYLKYKTKYLALKSKELPKGWIAFEDEEGETYYRNINCDSKKNTKECSKWEKPTEEAKIVDPLPKDWKVNVDEGGILYFRNENCELDNDNEECSTWTRPTKPSFKFIVHE